MRVSLIHWMFPAVLDQQQEFWDHSSHPTAHICRCRVNNSYSTATNTAALLLYLASNPQIKKNLYLQRSEWAGQDF